MTITTLKRVFKTGSTELQDPDPTLSPDEVRQHWAPNFPHLATATVSEPEQKNDTLVYVFEAPQAKTKGAGERSARWIWDRLIQVMDEDSGSFYLRTIDPTARLKPRESDFVKAEPAIGALVAAGYFADDPDDLDFSFWQMAAGEETERRKFFDRAPEAFEQLGAVLDEVFERVDDDEQTPPAAAAGTAS